ncbi:hypothetical protein BBO_02673 [Beauveria brongniartii RCEF 3172]|uniref:A-kinase anchor protein 7-like phosphoesterase domain-containing protein n=1 Tax=Beauveria brongniartii RCEF 3172 TaxID=1081107 RepID=A0A162JPN9_9HYPO|nr:hypothetical protein BBO_02673 [Beauveria brongniartii RCEF 3172]
MAGRQAAPARRGTNPTHFLCIPLLRRQLALRVAAFRVDVTDIHSAAPLPPDAMRPPGTMHITLGVMSLPQPARLARAVALLKELRLRDVLAETRATLRQRARGLSDGTTQDGSVWLTLRGLRAMQDPASTVVLYAPPTDADGQGAGLLYAFCQAVRARFIEEGLMEAERRPFLLHATVVNTAHVRSGRGGGRRRERLLLDARALMEEYAEHVWLERHEVRSLAICRMGAKPKGDTGDEAYEVVEEVTV